MVQQTVLSVSVKPLFCSRSDGAKSIAIFKTSCQHVVPHGVCWSNVASEEKFEKPMHFLHPNVNCNAFSNAKLENTCIQLACYACLIAVAIQLRCEARQQQTFK